jgi:hypothetical protein
MQMPPEAAPAWSDPVFGLIADLLAIIRDPEAAEANLTKLRNSSAVFLATKAEAEAALAELKEARCRRVNRRMTRRDN